MNEAQLVANKLAQRIAQLELEKAILQSRLEILEIEEKEKE